ncbi:MAG: ATP phosphoribosyltransferase regulatory subunit [Synergistaceae bacterium]|nr:ATP phosphoribosyltransferase regulatory subunit [Synergistaceae bacterium]
MNREPKGTRNIGGAEAEAIETIRGKLLSFLARHGYTSFSPAGLQGAEDVWKNLPSSVAKSAVPVMSPWGESCVLPRDNTLSAVSYLASHFDRSELPLRISYASRIYSVPQLSKDSIEENQIGAEIFGAPAKSADAEIATLLFDILTHLGIDNPYIVFGDVSVVVSILDKLPRELAGAIYSALEKRSFVEYNAVISQNKDKISGEILPFLEKLTDLRGGNEVLSEASNLLGESDALKYLTSLSNVLFLLGFNHEVRFDLSLVKDLGYYNGVIFNVYTHDGTALGSGGRYNPDFIREHLSCEAVGFGLSLKKLAAEATVACSHPNVCIFAGNATIADVMSVSRQVTRPQVIFWKECDGGINATINRAISLGFKDFVDVEHGRVYDLVNKKELKIPDYIAFSSRTKETV